MNFQYFIYSVRHWLNRLAVVKLRPVCRLVSNQAERWGERKLRRNLEV